MTPEPQLPLYSLFINLQNNDFDLGISDYRILITSIQNGFGLGSKTDLKKLCRCLWFKPGKSPELFDSLFEHCIQYEKKLFAAQKQDDQKQVQDPANPVRTNVEKTADPKQDSDLKDIAPQNLKNEEAPGEFNRQEEISLSMETLPENVLGKGSTVSGEKETLNKQYLLKHSYVTLGIRQLSLHWRFLRDEKKTYNSANISIQGTISKYVSDGVLSSLVYIPYKENQAQLITLIDHEGSMIAFENVAKSIAFSAYNGARVKNRIYYFYNVPQDSVFEDTAHRKGITLNRLLQNAKNKETALLIISDAGAARGHRNEQRIIEMKAFLKKAEHLRPKVALINPMPEKRWLQTSAEAISKIVPMFEATDAGINMAIKVLRGKLY